MEPILPIVTSDNAKEFANHKKVYEIKYFFSNPYCSWERGANENLNGFVRKYFSKIHNFDLITQKELLRVTNKLNNRLIKKICI